MRYSNCASKFGRENKKQREMILVFLYLFSFWSITLSRLAMKNEIKCKKCFFITAVLIGICSISVINLEYPSNLQIEILDWWSETRSLLPLTSITTISTSNCSFILDYGSLFLQSTSLLFCFSKKYLWTFLKRISRFVSKTISLDILQKIVEIFFQRSWHK